MVQTWRIDFLKKKVKLCFSLFIPLDPDPWTQMNSDLTGFDHPWPTLTLLKLKSYFVKVIIYFDLSGSSLVNIIISLNEVNQALIAYSCVLRTTRSSWNYADPFTSLELLNYYLNLAMCSRRSFNVMTPQTSISDMSDDMHLNINICKQNVLIQNPNYNYWSWC